MSLRNRSANFAALAAVLAGVGAFTGAAQADDWQNRVNLYLLVPWIDVGVTTNGGASTDTSADPGDVLSALDFGFMVAGEAKKGKFSLLYDVIYSDISGGGTLTGPFSSSVDVETKLLYTTIAAAYEVYEQGEQSLQILGGVRYVDFKTSVSVVGGGPIGAAASAEADVDWFDPVIGIRGRTPLNDRLMLGGYANVGGFGVGSELTYDLYGGVEYALNDRTSMNFGLRYISIEYESSNATIDMDQYGPVIGVTMKF